MTSPPVTIEPGRRVAAAAELMISKRVNRLPVVAAGKLVGIVSRADLVRAFARSDAEVAHEIREDVIEGHLLLEPHVVGVEVEAGEVLLSGALGRRSQADLLPKLVSTVPGVVAVRSELTWGFDDTR